MNKIVFLLLLVFIRLSWAEESLTLELNKSEITYSCQNKALVDEHIGFVCAPNFSGVLCCCAPCTVATSWHRFNSAKEACAQIGVDHYRLGECGNRANKPMLK